MKAILTYYFMMLFFKMGFMLDRLGKLDSPLIKFFRDSILIEGVILLPIMASQSL